MRFISDAGTTVLDVFLKQKKGRKATDIYEVSFETETNNIILKMKPGPRVYRLPPLQIYVVVDYFAGHLNAETPFSLLTRLQELRGPIWLLRGTTFVHTLVWWVYATAFYLSLMTCSYYFFAGTIFPAQWFHIALVVLTATLVLQIIETIITKKITRQQITPVKVS